MAVATTRPAVVPAPEPAFLVVDDVVKRFATPDRTITPVDHVSFTVTPAEFLSVFGPSCCGQRQLHPVQYHRRAYRRLRRQHRGCRRTRRRPPRLDRHGVPGGIDLSL